MPLLVNDGEAIRETVAIALYLTELFPLAGMGPRAGEPRRGTYMAWLAYYAAVVEPVMVLAAAGIEHPILTTTFRSVPELTAHLAEGLGDTPYLLSARYSAADLILASPFAWFPDATPDVPAIRDWVARTQGRDSVRRTAERDARWTAGR